METPRFFLMAILLGMAPACDGGGEDGVFDESAGLSPDASNGAAGGSSELGGAGASSGAGGSSELGGAGGSSSLGRAGASSGAGASSELEEPSGGRPPAPQPAPGPLPDLVLDAAYLVDTVALDVVNVEDPCLVEESCVTGLGERRVVRFGSRTGNVGTADFVLGTPGADNPLWTANTCQESFDLVGFARYELVDPATGDLVLAGAKNGFCIADAEPWIPESGVSCEVYDCTGQGISRGCADNYGSALECQWVDVTEVPPGAYELRVTINADRNIPELDYANNRVTVPLQLSDDSVTVIAVSP